MTDCLTACRMMEKQFRSGGRMPLYNTALEDLPDRADSEFEEEEQVLGEFRNDDEEDNFYIDPELNFLGISRTMHIWE